MVRSVLFLLLYLVTTTLMFPVALFSVVFRLFRLHKLERRYINLMASFLSWFYIVTAGSRVEVRGRENTEGLQDKAVCVVSNHQGIADIPVIVLSLPFYVGFIAKRELLYFPWVGIMMWAIRCVPIKRTSPRSAIKAIEKGVENIKKGFPMLIFPEGTRSRGDKMNPFKKGSLKLATRSRAIILPVTVQGSYRALEEKGKLTPARISLTFHEPIDTSDMDKEELSTLYAQVETVVRSGLEEGSHAL
jgi:1-acyl-sn-glycerol-3-phosphate acyltransferase